MTDPIVEAVPKPLLAVAAIRVCAVDDIRHLEWLAKVRGYEVVLTGMPEGGFGGLLHLESEAHSLPVPRGSWVIPVNLDRLLVLDHESFTGLFDVKGPWFTEEPEPATVERVGLPVEWAAEDGRLVVDPDGWRGQDGRSFDDLITREEFQRRSSSSTTAPLAYPSGWAEFECALERSGLPAEKVAELRELGARHRS